tara:strand:- start:15569 stop:16591 length:1023 start_codon:yes stop_codon:yes gene_type:complete
MLNNLIQVLVASFLIIILAIIAYSIYNKEVQTSLFNMTKSVVVKKTVPVFKGVMPLSSTVNPKYNTSDVNNGTFRDLQPSVNQKGGAEYSYNFWIYNDDNLDNSNDKKSAVLFLRGSDQMIQYNSDYNCMTDGAKSWFLVKNPLVRMYIKNSKIESVIAEFNSITDPDAFHINHNKPNCGGSHEEKFGSHLGIFGLGDRSDIQKKWIMITLVVQETNPNTDILFRNKANVKMYINGFEHYNKNADLKYDGNTVGSTAMKHNKGHLYINPGSNSEITNDSNIQMADLTYFNYALKTDEIVQLHKDGFTKGPAAIPNENTASNIHKENAGLDTESSTYVKPY